MEALVGMVLFVGGLALIAALLPLTHRLFRLVPHRSTKMGEAPHR